MGVKKYKYFFKRPRAEIVKDILYWLTIAGAVSIAATSPYFVRNVLVSYSRLKKYPKQKISDTFFNLRKQGLINIQQKNHQVSICLTDEGRKRAGWLQIDSLKIHRPKQWDGNWRLLMFDIAQFKKFYRDTFRGKIKALGFHPFQKSIWIHPFDCRAEIELLQKFFGLSDEELRLVLAKDIGNDKKFRKIFQI